ncbi:MAG: hypothetical protein ACR2MT_04870 [Aurantibacter sp.]
MLKSKGVRLGGSILTIIGTLIVLYDMFLAEEKKGIFESLGFFVFAIGLFVSAISGGLNKKEKGDKPKE